MKRNEKIAKILKHMAELYEINSVKGKPFAYRRAGEINFATERRYWEKFIKKRGIFGLEALPWYWKKESQRK
jgi:DNA polymerase/3'-5' exonuclease PolX